MKLKRSALGALAAVALASASLAIGATSAGADVVTRVTICHRTNSDTNPYVIITPDVSGVLDGHAKKHDDARIWGPTLKSLHLKWGDVIPAFDYMDGATLKHFPGLNLTATDGQGGKITGQDILDNGCVIPGEEPPPPPDTGSLDLTKIVTSTPPAGTPANFTIHVLCVTSGIDEDVVFGPTGDLALGDTKTFDGLLSGDTCTVSEDIAGFATGTAVHFTVDGVTTTPASGSVDVEIPVDDTVAVTVNNDFTDVAGEVVNVPGTTTPAPIVAPAAIQAAPVFTG